jgi:excisionase family DNA binding protein
VSAKVRGKKKASEAMLSSAEVAALCGVDPRTLRAWRAAGKIKGHKLGHRTVRFYRADVDRFLAGRG